MSIQESELAEFGEFEGEYEGEYESEYEIRVAGPMAGRAFPHPRQWRCRGSRAAVASCRTKLGPNVSCQLPPSRQGTMNSSSRKSHRKSRRGCVTCKLRRVKVCNFSFSHR